ncbi:MAG: YfjI family protein [Alphaproteobacteria bacterium]|nr:YfjI family protein [Alphaproteobacteria bacterium]
MKDAAASAVAPVDYVVAPLLAAASALIGNARWAQAWQGWKEPPHLWCAAIGDSGDGKSPGADTLNLYVLPVVERRMGADFPDHLREAQATIEAAKVRMENWKNELRDAVKGGIPLPCQPGAVPQEPLAPRLVLSDVTIERVASMLAAAAPKGVLMIRDELAGWLLGMNTYNDGGRAFWLEAYGGRRYAVDRQKSAEPIIVPHLAVSWYGGTQPGRIAEVLQGADDGLLARFMWFWPDPFPFDKPRRPPDTDWVITAFDRLRMLELASTDDGPAPLPVMLDDAAVQRMVAFARTMQERRETTTGLTRSAVGKARGLVLRLSLVFQYLRWCGEDGYAAPPATIGEDALVAAAKFVSEYVLPMAERTYGDAKRPEVEHNAATLARWVAGQRPDVVHVRHVQRNVRLPGLVTADAIHTACRELIEAGWLRKPAGGTGFQQRGAKAYPVSPRLIDLLK